MKDSEGVFSERRKARASRGVREHAPPEISENLGLDIINVGLDGRRAEITEISDNIFFFEKKLCRSRANVSHDIEKNGVIYFQSRRRFGVK